MSPRKASVPPGRSGGAKVSLPPPRPCFQLSLAPSSYHPISLPPYLPQLLPPCFAGSFVAPQILNTFLSTSDASSLDPLRDGCAHMNAIMKMSKRVQMFRDGNPPHPADESLPHQSNHLHHHDVQQPHQHHRRAKTPNPGREGRERRDGREGEGGEGDVSGARRRARTPQARAMRDDEWRLKVEARDAMAQQQQQQQQQQHRREDRAAEELRNPAAKDRQVHNPASACLFVFRMHLRAIERKRTQERERERASVCVRVCACVCVCV